MTELTKSTLIAKIEERLSKKELAAHYEVSDLEMGRILRFFELRVKSKRAKKEPKYTLIDDTQNVTVIPGVNTNELSIQTV